MCLGDFLILDYSPNSKECTCSLFPIFKTCLDSLNFICSLHQTSRDNRLSANSFLSADGKGNGILSPVHVGWGRGDEENRKDYGGLLLNLSVLDHPWRSVRLTRARYLLELHI